MPKRRDSIAMSETEMWEFIAGQKNVQVCTINADGTPHLTTMWFAIKDRQLVLGTYSKSQKIINLKRNPAIAVLLEDGDAYHDLRGVSINCNAELVEDYDTVHALHVDLLVRNQDGMTREEAQAFTADMCRKKTVILVKPNRVMSWDHRKLGGRY